MVTPAKLATPRFALNDSMKAYDTFGNAAEEGALKAIHANEASGTRSEPIAVRHRLH